MKPWWARRRSPVPLTLIRVYRAFRLDDQTIRCVVSRDPANGDVSPIDYRWRHDGRNLQVGDAIDLPDHAGRLVTIVRRDWRDDEFHLTAHSISLYNPDRP